MKIGLISDVHANVVALRTVLNNAPAVEEWLHAGDVVGYGPWPQETIALFRERDITSIQGNHDRAVLGDFHEGFDDLPRKMAEWTTDRLSEGELAYLDSLPVERERYDGRVHVSHGAPDAPNRYTYPEDIDAALLRGADVLVLGHTHEQVRREFEAGIVVNPGSVGQPRDGDWQSAYAVLDLETGEINLQRVAYPTDIVQEQCREYGFPDVLIDAYETGGIVPGERAKRSSVGEQQDKN